MVRGHGRTGTALTTLKKVVWRFAEPRRITRMGRLARLKRPPKTPDRVYPVVKNQEYDRVYDWEYRPG